MTQSELDDLLRGDLESDRVERTISTTDTDKFAKAVCAFANDFSGTRSPGRLLIGVRPDGSLSGMKAEEALLQKLAGLRSDGNILPPPALTISTYSREAGDVVVVEVAPSDLPPVRFKGTVWIRTGPRQSIANEQEERILSERRVSFARSFDARPCMEARIEDLALELFEAYRRRAVDPEAIRANHRSLEEQLSSLRFLDPASGRPTTAGILLFGTNPRYFFPGAYVQFARFPGTLLTDGPEDQAEISGDLATAIREIELRIRACNRVRLVRESSFGERELPDYPEVSLRELIVNAVLHRDYESNTPTKLFWYSDRIEIHNPGGLYGEVTLENFRERSSYRNPVLAEALKTLGYVNRFGLGIPLATRLLMQNGNGAPRFLFEDPRSSAVVIPGRHA